MSTMAEQLVREVTMQDLGLLPMRATVAFAVRCASRVHPMLQSGPDSPARQLALDRADAALAYAAQFARGEADQLPAEDAMRTLAQQIYEAAEQVAGDRRFAAYAAGHALEAVATAVHIAAEQRRDEALNLVASAWGAYRVLLGFVSGLLFKDMFTGDMVMDRIRADYEQLLAMRLGRLAELGGVVDPSEQGPLGKLWPDQRPCWLNTAEG
jgi:hypothetical protein